MIYEISVVVFRIIRSSISALIFRNQSFNISSLYVIILFFSHWISCVFGCAAVYHIDRLFSRWLESLSHVWMSQLLEFHRWFFLQTLSHASYSLVHLHLPTFCVVVRWNIWVIRVSVASLSENRVLSIDLWGILTVHLGIVYKLLARIADSAS